MEELRLLNVAEVGQVCGICERTVRRLMADGELPVVRVGGSVRVSTEALEEFIRQGGTPRRKQDEVLI